MAHTQIRTTQKEKIHIPTNSWSPLPMELSLRRYILAKVRGAWSRHKDIDPVAWQRNIRAEDEKRMLTIEKQMKKFKKKK